MENFTKMRLMRGLTLLFFAFGLCSQASAGIRPSFRLESCAWRATHIVTVTEGKKIDGVFQVLESWKGDLLPGETLKIPELASFNSLKARYINLWWGEKQRGTQPTYVTGDRMILFLRDAERTGANSEDEGEGEDDKAKTSPSRWKSANSMGNEMNVSVVWIEQGEAYGFLQLSNPGPSLLCSLRSTETEIKDQVLQILNTQNTMSSVFAISDPMKRAEALRPYVSSELYSVSDTALTEISRCGQGARQVLLKMLGDDSLADVHDRLIEILVKTGGPSVAGDLTAMVEKDLEFWKKVGSTLQVGWWDGTGFSSEEEVEPLRNRYNKTYSTLLALSKLHYKECERVATELRDYWLLLPQLQDIGDLEKINEICDEILKTLHQSDQ